MPGPGGEPTPPAPTGAPRAAVYLQGRGVACTLGPDLPSALDGLAAPAAPPSLFAVGGERFPQRRLAPARGEARADPRAAVAADLAWWQQCVDLVRRVGREAGARPGDALIVASSSFDIGRLERGGTREADGLHFAERLAREALGLDGPVYTVANACTSAYGAVAFACELLQDPALAGALVLGLECPNAFSVGGFAAMQLVQPVAPDAEPAAASPGARGLVLGEAVAALRLARTPARWRVAGVSQRIDGRDPAATNPEALAAAVGDAFGQAGIGAADVAWVKRHRVSGDGADPNDRAEAEVLEALFGGRATPPAWLDPKARLGHTQGASGALEIALATAAIERDEAARRLASPVNAPILGEPSSATGPRGRLLALGVGFGGGHAVVVLDPSGEAVPVDRAGSEPPRDPAPTRPADAAGLIAAAAMPADSPGSDRGATAAPGDADFDRDLQHDLDRDLAQALAALPARLPAQAQVLRFAGNPPPEGWREALAARLGGRPRRLGRWAELALWGAFGCLDAAGLATLPAGACLRLCSANGPTPPLDAALASLRAGELPMPFAFLQSQPAVGLAALAAALRWQGDALVLSHREAAALLRLYAPRWREGVLLGWVDERPALRSTWCWIGPSSTA